MSAAAGTKIFGIRLGLDPKVLVGGLLAFSALLFWFNSRNDEAGPTGSSVRGQPVTSATAPDMRNKPRIARHSSLSRNNRDTLKYVPVDGTRGDIDPTLHVDLLSRLQTVKLNNGLRNLFEMGTEQQVKPLAQMPKGPIVPVKPLPNSASSQGALNVAVNIPLKYYGFVKPNGQAPTNQGFFLDGDNVLLASEGELVMKRYLVVSLNPSNARMEDTVLKQGQTLSVVPEAVAQ
jgi:hypothetical protein